MQTIVILLLAMANGLNVPIWLWSIVGIWILMALVNTFTDNVE